MFDTVLPVVDSWNELNIYDGYWFDFSKTRFSFHPQRNYHELGK